MLLPISGMLEVPLAITQTSHLIATAVGTIITNRAMCSIVYFRTTQSNTLQGSPLQQLFLTVVPQITRKSKIFILKIFFLTVSLLA
jgi:hypothetical protein